MVFFTREENQCRIKSHCQLLPIWNPSRKPRGKFKSAKANLQKIHPMWLSPTPPLLIFSCILYKESIGTLINMKNSGFHLIEMWLTSCHTESETKYKHGKNKTWNLMPATALLSLPNHLSHFHETWEREGGSINSISQESWVHIYKQGHNWKMSILKKEHNSLPVKWIGHL